MQAGARLVAAAFASQFERAVDRRISVLSLAALLIPHREQSERMPYTTYAIGDVHGRADFLAAMVQEIEQDAMARHSKPRIIFLGDIIDRGPSSCQAMEITADVLRTHPHSRFIIGNHDDRFFDFVSGRSTNDQLYAHWAIRMYGINTLRSYGYDEKTTLPDLSDSFRKKFPHHFEILESAERLIIDPVYAYVHAGINPEKTLDDQTHYELMWIRDAFTGWNDPLPRIFVHGHTPTETRFPDFHPYRINIDTGACASNRLCCLSVDADESELRTLYAEGSGRAVELGWQPVSSTIPDAVYR